MRANHVLTSGLCPNSAKTMNFKGVGGGEVDDTIPLSNIILTYEETGVGLSFEDGEIGGKLGSGRGEIGVTHNRLRVNPGFQ